MENMVIFNDGNKGIDICPIPLFSCKLSFFMFSIVSSQHCFISIFSRDLSMTDSGESQVSRSCL